MDTSKGTGADQLEPFFLKLASNIISYPLAHLFNLSLNNGTIPILWKRAHVVTIHKGGSQRDVANYRPISLLPVLAKCLEKVVLDQLKAFINSNNLLSPIQSGFRSGHGTITAVTKVMIFQEVWIVSRWQLQSIDLSDTVDHKLLCDRLGELGLSDKAIDRFCSYLTDRKQMVKGGGMLSSIIEI